VAEKVVIFLHGFQDCPFDPEEKGRAIKNRLEKDGYTVYSLSYSAGRPTMSGLYYSTEKVEMEIETLRIKKIDAVVGHSMGGIIACDFAKRYGWQYGIKTVIMLETPILGLPALLLRIWRFVSQRKASFSWSSIQDMRDDSDYVARLNRDWPSDILRFEIAGSLFQKMKRFYKLPEGIPVKVFPKVKHGGPDGLRGNPEVLEYIAFLLKTSEDKP